MTATGSVYVRGDGNTVNEPELPQGNQRETDPGLFELEPCAVKVARTVLRGGRSEQSAFPTRLYPEYSRPLGQPSTSRSVLVGLGLTVLLMYVFRKQVFYYTSRSLQGHG